MNASLYLSACLCLCIEEIDVTGCSSSSSSQDASIDSDDVYADDDDEDADNSDPVLSANKAFTMSLRLSRPLWSTGMIFLSATDLMFRT